MIQTPITDELGRTWEVIGTHSVRCTHAPEDIDALIAERDRMTAADTATALAEVKAWREQGCPPIEVLRVEVGLSGLVDARVVFHDPPPLQNRP